MRRLARGTPDSRPTRRRAQVLTTMVTPLLLLALAACGEPDSGPGVASAQTGGATPSASTTKGATEGDPVKFADCMRKYGIEVEVQDGGRGVGIHGGPGDEGKMEKAQQECRQYAPGGGEGDGQPMPKEDQAKFLAFAKCMRDNGIDMPDPEFEGGGVKMRMGGGPGAAEPDRSKMEAAQKTCQKLLPGEMANAPGAGQGGPAGGTGGGA
jgi:hypothetical protein